MQAADGNQYGPAVTSTFAAWIAEGRVQPESYLWREGWPDWRTAADAWAELPAPLPGATAATPERSSAIDRYARRKKQSSAAKALAALVLLALTLCLGGVLAYVLLQQNDDPPPADAPLPPVPGTMPDPAQAPPADAGGGGIDNQSEPPDGADVGDEPVDDPFDSDLFKPENDPFAEPAMEMRENSAERPRPRTFGGAGLVAASFNPTPERQPHA